MIEPSPAAPQGTATDKPSDQQPAERPGVGPTATASRSPKTRFGRRAAPAALIPVALTCGFAAGAIFFWATGNRKGLRDGCESVGYFEGKAIADSMKADASEAVLKLAGLLPEPSQHGLWHVARFELTRPRGLCRYGSTPELDTIRVPTFSSLAQARVGRSYLGGSGSRIHYVDR